MLPGTTPQPSLRPLLPGGSGTRIAQAMLSPNSRLQTARQAVTQSSSVILSKPTARPTTPIPGAFTASCWEAASATPKSGNRVTQQEEAPPTQLDLPLAIVAVSGRGRQLGGSLKASTSQGSSAFQTRAPSPARSTMGLNAFQTRAPSPAPPKEDAANSADPYITRPASRVTTAPVSPTLGPTHTTTSKVVNFIDAFKAESRQQVLNLREETLSAQLEARLRAEQAEALSQIEARLRAEQEATVTMVQEIMAAQAQAIKETTYLEVKECVLVCEEQLQEMQVNMQNESDSRQSLANDMNFCMKALEQELTKHAEILCNGNGAPASDISHSSRPADKISPVPRVMSADLYYKETDLQKLSQQIEEMHGHLHKETEARHMLAKEIQESLRSVQDGLESEMQSHSRHLQDFEPVPGRLRELEESLHVLIKLDARTLGQIVPAARLPIAPMDQVEAFKAALQSESDARQFLVREFSHGLETLGDELNRKLSEEIFAMKSDVIQLRAEISIVTKDSSLTQEFTARLGDETQMRCRSDALIENRIQVGLAEVRKWFLDESVLLKQMIQKKSEKNDSEDLRIALELTAMRGQFNEMRRSMSFEEQDFAMGRCESDVTIGESDNLKDDLAKVRDQVSEMDQRFQALAQATNKAIRVGERPKSVGGTWLGGFMH